MHPLTKLQTELEEHIENEEEKWDQLLEQHRYQTEAIANLAKAVTDLTSATEDLVLAWRTIQAIRAFAVWLSGFAVIGGVITWACKKYGIL